MSQKSGCLGFIFGNKALETETELPYKVRDDFLSSAELSFYKILTQIFGNRFVVCPKVSLKDLFFVTTSNQYMNHFNKINRKHIDFLICEKNMMKPLIGIELDDSSHSKQKRQERDLFVDEVFDAANLPLARVKASQSYNIEELKNYLNSVYRAKKAPTPMPDVKNYSNVENVESKEPHSIHDKNNRTTSSAKSLPQCPKCGVSLIIRKSRKGELFYGCSNYPKCKFTVDIDQ